MRKILLLCVGLALLCSPAFARAGDLGLGVILGEPTGLTLKQWNGTRRAWDAALAWSFDGEDALHLHCDYLLHRFDKILIDDKALPVYFGLGGRVKLREDDDVQAGLRFPLGLSCFFSRDELEFFLELAPTLDLIPGSDFNVSGGLGLRFYF